MNNWQEWARNREAQSLRIYKLKGEKLHRELPEWTHELSTRIKRAMLLEYVIQRDDPKELVLTPESVLAYGYVQWVRVPNMGVKSTKELLDLAGLLAPQRLTEAPPSQPDPATPLVAAPGIVGAIAFKLEAIDIKLDAVLGKINACLAKLDA